MKLAQIQEGRIKDLGDRMASAMYDNWFGGDTIVVKNIVVRQEGSEFGLRTEIVDRYFTHDELKLIEKENILDRFREEGWDIEITHIIHSVALANTKNIDNVHENIQWLFKAKKT